MKKGQAINLVSFEARDSIRFEMLSIFVLRIGVTIFLMFLGMLIFMLTSLGYVISIKSGIEHQVEIWTNLEQNTENSTVKQDIKYVTALMQDSAKLVKDDFFWSAKIESVVKSLPPSIHLLTFSGAQTQKQIIMGGIAPTRNDVLVAKDELSKLPFVSEVKSPLNNVVPEKNINFSFTLILK